MYRFQLNRQLEKKEAENLRNLNALKNRLYTNITHEFRTPLTVISGMADKVEGQEKVKNLIKRNSISLLKMVNQILDLRKLESGKLQLQYTQGDVIAYIRYISESFSSLAENKEVQLNFHAELPELIMDYDPDKLMRIVSNLLSNAIKFTPEEGRVDVYISQESPEQLMIKVQDTGIGIPKEELPHIFERFYQVDTENGRERVVSGGGGSGIGLSMTYELVKLLNGEITVESPPPADGHSKGHPLERSGSIFKVYLPITRTAQQLTAAVGPNLSKPELQGHPPITSNDQKVKPAHESDKQLPNLLIVEDSEDIVQYLITCLEGQYQLEVAKDGQEGIEKAFESPPDIILSDIMMPRKNGFELCQTLKLDERTSHIPVVLLTAKAGVESRIEGLKRGADAYLAKPFNEKELLVSLQKLVEIRHRLRERYSRLEVPQASEDPALQIEDAFMQKIRAAVEKNMDNENFGAPELTRALGMSSSSLYAKIKALTGRSPALLIRSIRLTHAKSLLQTTDLNITQVAFEVGFSNLSYFSRCFSQEFGITPKQFKD